MLHKERLRTGARDEMIDITRQVAEAVSRSGISEGTALVFCPHTTAGIAIDGPRQREYGVKITEG